MDSYVRDEFKKRKVMTKKQLAAYCVESHNHLRMVAENMNGRNKAYQEGRASAFAEVAILLGMD